MKQSLTQPVTPTATAPPNGHQTLSAYIRARFDEFSRSQKDVAQYIVDHLDEAAFQTAEELARRASTSSSTVVRFSQALGFEGFPELQQAARDEYRRRPPGLSGGAANGVAPLFSLDHTEFEAALAADHVNVEDTAHKLSRGRRRGRDRRDRVRRQGADRRDRPDGVLRQLSAAPVDAARSPGGDRRQPVRGGAWAPQPDRRAHARHRPVGRPAPSPDHSHDEARAAPQGADDGDHRRDALRGRAGWPGSGSTTRRTRRRSSARTLRCCR